MDDLEREIKRQQRELKSFLLRAPKVVGRIAKEEFTLNFRRQGYIDTSGVLHPWPKRKVQMYRRRGMTGKRSSKLRLTKAGKADKGRAILVKSGAMRRGVRVQSTDSDSVTLSNALPYARRHNDGEKMPRRPFMVESKVLTDRIKTMIEQNIQKIFR